MIVVVDSSVAIKWFLAEPGHTDAIALGRMASRIFAPELLIAEVSNVAWKEAIRGKIDAEQARAIALQIARAPIKYIPIGDLHARALEIAIEVNHSVYDCLYLACAERHGANLITADRRLLNKTRSFSFSHFISLLDSGAPVTGDMPRPLHVSRHTLEQAIKATSLFEATHRNVIEQITRNQTGELKFHSAQEAALAFQSPGYRKLENIYASLAREEKIDFLSLGWLGQGHSGSNWEEIRERARSFVSDEHARYILSLAIHLRAGLDTFDGRLRL